MKELIEAGRSLATTQGRQSAGEETPIVFDMDVSYEQTPTALPNILSSERETLLLTVHLASNGEIVQHRNRSSRSVDAEDGLSATYIALLSWLLSLVPQEFSFLQSSGSSSDPPLTLDPPFHVVGLQQMWLEDELRLFVAVTPSEAFYSEAARHSWPRKGKQKDDKKISSRFGQHVSRFLSVSTLNTVCPWLSALVPVEVKSDCPEEKNAPQFSYSLPLPKISTKPLSTFIQVNPDTNAARKVFSIPVGFHWQTVDTEESWCDINDHDSDDNDDVCYETQNTMSLIYRKIFHDPVSLMAILSRICQDGLDLAGVRLLYPSPELLKTQNTEVPPLSDLDILNNVGPVLALAIRGAFARSVWMDSVGPSDPEVARRTIPNSLCAVNGGESWDHFPLFCPRSHSNVQNELIRWFGGRVPSGATSVDVGSPYVRKEEGKGKRMKKSNTTLYHKRQTVLAQHPPATLTATSKSDVFLVVSPLVPASYFDVLIATSQRKGYQIRGVKRLRLSLKSAGSLGISTSMVPTFCPGIHVDEMCKNRPIEAIAPCTVFMLRKENAAHNASSLIEAIMVQLTLAGLLGCIQMRLRECLYSKHLFHWTAYTDVTLAMIGRNMSKVPDLDLSHLQLSSHISEAVMKDVEQVAVVIILGHKALRKCGLFVGKILNALSDRKTPGQSFVTKTKERFELLGLKWTPSLTTHQAKELTPFEVGEKMWRGSVDKLMSEPALVLVLRGVNIFTILEPVVTQQQQQVSASPGSVHRGLMMTQKERRIEYMMSQNPSESDVFVRLFFDHNELYPDPLSRTLLPYLPESMLYFNIVEREENGHIFRILSLKPPEELDFTQENIMEEMVAGQQPITTLMLIKPGAVQKYLQRILRKVVQEQFVIVGLRLLMIAPDAAAAFIPLLHKKENGTHLQNHIEAMTSGPAMALALKHHNVVKKLCDLIGPEDPVVASRQSQFLWRGEFGTDIYNNGLYCSETFMDAVRDLKLFFPDGLCCSCSDLLAMKEIPAMIEDSVIDVNASVTRNVTLTCKSSHVRQQHEVTVQDAHDLLLQTTCLVLTPALMTTNSRSKVIPGIDLLAVLLNNSFKLVGARLLWLTQNQTESLLNVVGGTSFSQVTYLCSGPCLVLAMQRDNAVLAFDLILNQHSESFQLMKEHGHHLLRPSSINQSHALLKFFFDELVPRSQLTICTNPCKESNETRE